MNHVASEWYLKFIFQLNFVIVKKENSCPPLVLEDFEAQVSFSQLVPKAHKCLG